MERDGVLEQAHRTWELSGKASWALLRGAALDAAMVHALERETLPPSLWSFLEHSQRAQARRTRAHRMGAVLVAVTVCFVAVGSVRVRRQREGNVARTTMHLERRENVEQGPTLHEVELLSELPGRGQEVVESALRFLRAHPEERSSLRLRRALATGVQDFRRSFALRGHSASVEAIAISPDGTRIASSSIDRTVRIWNAENGTAITSFRIPTEVHKLAYSPDGRTLLLRDRRNESIYWWNGTGLQTICRTVSEGDADCRDAVFSADSSRLYYQQRSLLFEHSLATATATTYRIGSDVRLVGVSEENRVALLTERGRLYWLDRLRPLRRRAVHELNLGTHGIFDTHRDAARFIVGTTASRFVIWTNDLRVDEWNSLGCWMDDAFVAGKRLLLSACRNGLAVYSEEDEWRQIVHTEELPHAVALARRDSLRMVGGHRGELLVWGTPWGAGFESYRAHAASIRALATSPDGEVVVSASRDGTLRIWRASELQRGSGNHWSWWGQEMESNSRRLLVQTLPDYHLSVRERTTQREILRMRYGREVLAMVAFSEDEQSFVTVDGRNLATHWSFPSGEMLSAWQLPSEPEALSVSDGVVRVRNGVREQTYRTSVEGWLQAACALPQRVWLSAEAQALCHSL